MICCEEVAGELVISGGDASPVLDATEEVFDFVPAAIDGLRAIGLLGRVAATGNGWNSAIIGTLLARLGAVIGLVSDDEQWRSGGLKDFSDGLAVMDLPTGEHEVQWPALAIDTGVDFRAAPAPTDTDRLVFLPPFAPLDAR